MATPDDQIVATSDEATASEVQFRASKELVKIGLNLNAHKVRNLNRQSYSEYWAFDIMAHLLGETHDVNEAFRMFTERRRTSTEFRETTILKRLLSMTSAEVAPFILEIMEIITSPTEITKFDSSYLSKLYGLLLTDSARAEFVERLNQLSGKVMNNEFHLRVQFFAKSVGLPKERISRVTENLSRLDQM